LHGTVIDMSLFYFVVLRTSLSIYELLSFFFFTATSTTIIYTLSLHDALPISTQGDAGFTITGGLTGPGSRIGSDVSLQVSAGSIDRKSTRLNSSHVKISYAVFCLKKKKKTKHLLALLKIQITAQHIQTSLSQM